ncbi:hypothetical protein [Photobacterium leiognathi]|uniref:hypothetical protein n=1 Tax=Photobacterium leiognathi TaxID=553611 RepID=UPI00273340CE|nr:hypothetical protein [Photobacterium leiognathi]
MAKADTNKTIQLSDSFTLSDSNWQKIDKLYQQQQKLKAKQDGKTKKHQSKLLGYIA